MMRAVWEVLGIGKDIKEGFREGIEGGGKEEELRKWAESIYTELCILCIHNQGFA